MAGVKNHARMDGDSEMLGNYVHLSGADIEKKIYFDTVAVAVGLYLLLF